MTGRKIERGAARARILELLRANVGRVVTKDQIAAAAGISEGARRVRELRDELGYVILGQKDRPVRLVVDHIYPVSRAEEYGIDPYSDQNLQTLCDVCSEGKWSKYAGRLGEARLDLEALVRHAPLEEQRRVYEPLRRISEPGARP